jgi:folate-binding protein YgfZ
MPVYFPKDRSVIRVSGAEAEHFLQNLVTCDIDGLGGNEARPCALLTPQGKIMFDFLVLRDGEGGYLIDIRADQVADFLKRLTLYKLRAKVEISESDQVLAGITWESDSGPADARCVRDTRFPDGAAVYRYYGDRFDTGVDDAAGWSELRIAHGVAESGTDFGLSEAFPHDVSLDQNRGVDFRKGCYVGQEVVSRMQHRGTARRRVVIVETEGTLPATGTAIEAGGKPIGTLGTVSGGKALAIVRLDRAKDAIDNDLPITAGDARVGLRLPPGIAYSWPETAATGE